MILRRLCLFQTRGRRPQRTGQDSLPPELTLGPPQREQEINLIVWDRLTLDVRVDNLELGSDMLSGIRGKRRRCELPVQGFLVTHEPTCLYLYTGIYGRRSSCRCAEASPHMVNRS